MARLTTKEVIQHPGYANAVFDLIPTQEGLLPVAKDRGGPFKISWEVHGTGPIKVVFVMGLGAIKSAWQRQTLHFGHTHGDQYSCLILDNRGMGKSDKPIRPRYSTSELAKDVYEIIDHIGWTQKRQLHVIGVSMGGMISQEIAYAQPERLASLTIVSSAARVENTTSFTENLWNRVQMFLPKSLEQSTRNVARSMFSDEWLDSPDDRNLPTPATPNVRVPEGGYDRFDTNYDAFAAFEVTKKRDPSGAFTKKGFIAQAICAGWHYKSDEQLKEIADEVGRDRIMVLHGTGDQMLTFPHGEVLRKGLEPVRWWLREGKGHVLLLEDENWFHGVLEEHIRETEALKGKEGGA